MGALRRTLHDHRTLAALLLALVLCLKALVPAGYMVSSESRVLTVRICSDATGAQQFHRLILPGKQDSSGGSAAAKDACPYSVLGSSALAGADPVLLALALAFVLALGFAPRVVPELPDAFRLRPPLRGPPAAA